MGNYVGVMTVPLGIDHVLDSPVSAADLKDPGLCSAVLLWRLYDGEQGIDSEPIDFMKLKQLDRSDCYICVHCQYFPSKAKSASSTVVLPGPTSDNDKSSLHSLLSSWDKSLTPRGLRCSFGSITLEPFLRSSNSSFGHDLYIWNGKSASDVLKSIALAKAFDLNRHLEKDNQVVPSLFSRASCVPISSAFFDDVRVDSLERHNHLMYQVCRHLRSHHLGARNELSSTHWASSFVNSSVPETFIDSNKLIARFVKKKERSSGSSKGSRKQKRNSRNSSSGSRSTTMPVNRPGQKSPKCASTSGISMALNINTLAVKSSEVKNQRSELQSKRERLARFDPLCSQIVDSLYLASETVAKNRNILEKNEITHVLNCAGTICPNYFPDSFEYLKLHLCDGKTEDISCLFLKVIEYIDNIIESGGRVLVHCQQGVSRSSAMLISYLMWVQDTDFNTTHLFVKSIRGVCSPNSGFISQLLTHYNHTHEPVKHTRLYRVAPHNVAASDMLVVRIAKEGPDGLSRHQLDTRGAHILSTNDCIYLWLGRECPELLRKEGKEYIRRFQKYGRAATTSVTLEQGQETEAFMKEFTGDAPKASDGEGEEKEKPGEGELSSNGKDGASKGATDFSEVGRNPLYNEEYHLLAVARTRQKKAAV